MVRRRIDEFELGVALGVGTVGTIYRAQDLKHDRVVAVKILHPTVSSDKLIRARFEREMLILAKLSHPHIVQYYGGGRVDDQLFYAMELVEGGNLRDMLQQSGCLNWEETATCGIQISSALQHAHNHGVIHRDLKPSNLFLSPSGDLKLGDFGIARDTHNADITAEGLTVGTYAYMSPEQIVSDRDISGKTDLYALGCLLFELLSGRSPFVGDNFAQLFEQHLHSTPPGVRAFAPACPAELDALIARLMSKNPEDRPFNARSVQAGLMQLTDGIHRDVNTSRDLPADQTVDRGRAALSKRLQRLETSQETRNVSWLSLACLMAAVIGVVWVAWFFGP